MEITVENIAMFRENLNPKNANLNLDIDWYVDYTGTDQRNINYDIVLKSEEYFNLNFKIGGLIKLGDFEEFIQEDCSQIVFHHACNILMNVISLTRQANYEMFNYGMDSAVNMNATF